MNDLEFLHTNSGSEVFINLPSLIKFLRNPKYSDQEFFAAMMGVSDLLEEEYEKIKKQGKTIEEVFSHGLGSKVRETNSTRS